MLGATPRQVVAGFLVTALLAMVLVLNSFAQTPAPIPTPPNGATPTPEATPSPTATVAGPKPTSITDTEYVSVRIDANGKPLEVGVKEWYRVRKEGGGKTRIEDPGVLERVRGLSGWRRPKVRDGVMTMNVKVPEAGHADVYIAGKPPEAGGGAYATAAGPRLLPVSVEVRYYTGEPGSEEAATQANARTFARHHGPFKLVITVRNNTKRTEEVTYNDVQTKQNVTGIAEIYAPFSVKIPSLVLPDGDYDAIRTNGVLSRRGKASVVDWNLFLAPPDYPGEQHAIVEGRVNAPEIPRIDVIAQPVYPDPVAEALSSAGTQFQKGRRAFLHDQVFGLFRESLIALGGLFSVLDDTFSNLALPLIGPEKGNRDSGSFTDANLLWGVWTVAKGTEQLARAVNALDYAVQLARDGVKGEIATMQLLRAFIGKSTDQPVLSESGLLCLPPACIPSEQQIAQQADQLLGESMWANLKDLEVALGAPTGADVPGGPQDPLPYLPEAPASLSPQGALIITILKIKMAILEHNFFCLQYEDHTNDCSTILGVTNKPNAEGWDKFSFVKFPFGQIEVDRGLRAIETEGTEQIQAALGNKIQPNSFVWGTKVIVEGVEGLVDSFHQLGATWRFIADSIQNFGIFGVETSRSFLQLDINAIDIQSAAKAAAAKRAAETSTFLGKPAGSQGQLVLAFSTDPEPLIVRSTATKIAAAVALLSLLGVVFLFARFRWYLL